MSSGPGKPGPLTLASMAKVVLYRAEGCHLCKRALEVLEALRAEREFELVEIDIGGDEEFEARYREWLPVVEIDGERAFTYHVHRAAFLRRLDAAQARAESGSL